MKSDENVKERHEKGRERKSKEKIVKR